MLGLGGCLCYFDSCGLLWLRKVLCEARPDKTPRRPPEFRVIVTRAGFNETFTFASCVICCHILYHRICVTCAHLHISDDHTSDRHIISYIFASASHLRIFISQIFISYLYIFTFIFRSSYFETTSCLHTVGSSSRSHTVLSYPLQDFIMQLSSQLYNLIYLRLQNFISPLSGQPSSSFFEKLRTSFSSMAVWGKRRRTVKLLGIALEYFFDMT